MARKDRQKQILAAALQVFVQKGYHGATTAEIARAAGISEVTLFRHFESKKDIFKLSVEPIVITTLKESIHASSNLSKQDQLKYILMERMKLVSKNYAVIKLILMESQINEDLKDIKFMESMYEILRDNVMEIGFSIKDKKSVMRILMGSILSFLYMPESSDLEIQSFVEELIDLVIVKEREHE